MLNLSGIVATILEMATDRNFSISGINSGHHNLPTYEILLKSDIVDKDYAIGICFFSAKHAALRRRSKDWLARNQDSVSEWGDMSIGGLLFQ
jgi:hypothetical protein